MALPAHISSGSVRGLTRFPSLDAGARTETLVVAFEAVLAEAVALALSSCGVTARPARSLPWRPKASGGGGAALVLLGRDEVASHRVVRALVGSGWRVAVVASPGDPALPGCVAAGAEAIVPADAGLNDLVGVLVGLGTEGPVESPIGLDGLGADASRPDPGAPAAAVLLSRLTPREGEILSLLMAGRRADSIARRGYVSPHTVRTQIRSILRKLEVHSQIEAVAIAHSAGWIPGAPPA